MNRRTFIRVLLSLLLLISQQMAISHGMTHWAGASREGSAQLYKTQLHLAQLHKPASQDQERGISAAFAQDQTCEQCLAFAQIASAVGSPARTFIPDDSAACAAGERASVSVDARTAFPFQSRAPPSFA
jgi:hypothetical protein